MDGTERGDREVLLKLNDLGTLSGQWEVHSDERRNRTRPVLLTRDETSSIRVPA